MKAPKHLTHKPIITVDDYDKIDANFVNNTDAMALSIGKAQYNNKCISAKIWRRNEKGWSRQSEEMPLHRAIDLSILAIASFITEPKNHFSLTSLKETVIDEKEFKMITNYFNTNKHNLHPRLKELQSILNKYFEIE